MSRNYFVYILSSSSRELYVGVTRDLVKRVSQHRVGLSARGYTRQHGTTRLVYCESTRDVLAAIRREKQIKGCTRRKKLDLIEQMNPGWKDFAEDW